MLTGLNISNIVLIERLNLTFGAGLNILTGETGAGKSILMDALSLALGARSDSGLVRHGCEMASVTATFDGVDNALKPILDDTGIDYSDNILILRRTLNTDGKSRAWINDIPVSVKILKQIGDALVEIHGQFANHTLLDSAQHRPTLDSFALVNDTNFSKLLSDVQRTYTEYHNALRRLNQLQEMLQQSATEYEFLEHNIAELRALNPLPGEEDDLATRRAAMMNAEKDAAILTEATTALNPRGQSLDAMIFDVVHILQRIKTEPNPYAEQIDALYDAAQSIADVTAALRPTETDTDSLDSIEERLFAIRAVARKHRVPADMLQEKLAQMVAQQETIDNSDAELQKLTSAVKQYRAEFDAAAARLTSARLAAATQLRTRILAELPDLKLGGADFMVERAQTAPSASGCDEITFMIKTNPGMPFAPLHKSASGGELARLMLALRVVLAGGTEHRTFVFDEIDTGISGATASAVGRRLGQLAAHSQALVITHSAQVAGFGNRHFKIAKNTDGDKTITTVSEISGAARLNEIARIISGAEITPESLATAKTLLAQSIA